MNGPNGQNNPELFANWLGLYPHVPSDKFEKLAVQFSESFPGIE
jgi:hypothetical protein